MKRFVFRPQTLLRLRVRREEEGRRLLAGLLARQADAVAARTAASVALHRAGTEIRKAKTVIGLQAAAADVDYRRAQLQLAEAKVRDIQTRVKEAQARVLLLRRERRVVERLRERRLAGHRMSETRREQAQLDEIAVLRHDRSRR